MKIKIQNTEVVEKEVEILFPIYRKQKLETCTYFMKIESEEKEISICIDNDDMKVELEIGEPSFYGDENYILGKKEFQSSKEEFERAVSSLKEIIGLL